MTDPLEAAEARREQPRAGACEVRLTPRQAKDLCAGRTPARAEAEVH